MRFYPPVLCCLASIALAQTPPARRAYEVASIKPNDSGSQGTSSKSTAGQIVLVNQTLKRLVERAYNVKPFQVICPDWMESVRFDIVAKYPPDTNRDDRPLMLRTLLEDRFGLAVHTESKQLRGYALVLAKTGFKLRPVQTDGGETINENGNRIVTMTVKNVSMAALADALAPDLNQAVVDETGLKGVYQFELRWSNDEDLKNSADATPVAPSLFTALQETLGLRLQSQKVPVPIIVVDHIERAPTEN